MDNLNYKELYKLQDKVLDTLSNKITAVMGRDNFDEEFKKIVDKIE